MPAVLPAFLFSGFSVIFCLTVWAEERLCHSNNMEENLVYAKNNLTEGKIYPALIRFSLPVLGALFLQSLYGAVDLLVIGQFSTASDVSAVSNGAQIMATMTNVMASLSMGTTIVLGQMIGQKDRKAAGKIVGDSIVFFSILGFAVSILLAVFAPAITRLMRVPAEAVAATTVYLRICGGGMIVITLYNLIGSIFRAVGDSRTPLIAVTFACIGNIIGDLLLVAAFHMGAAGAAIATVLSQALSVILSTHLILRKELPFDFKKNMIRWDGQITGKILQLGTPIAVQDFLVSISFLVILAIVNVLGVTASAGVGVAEKVTAFIMLVPIAFMQAMAAFVAQNYGAGKLKRAEIGLRYAIGTAFAIGVVMSYLSFFHGGLLAGLFSRDPAVVQAGWDYLKAYAIDCLLTPVFFCMTGYFNGIGKTRFVMIQGIIGAFLVRIPVSFVMSRQKPVSLFHIGLATPASSILQIILCLSYFAYLKKNEAGRMNLIKKEEGSETAEM